MIDNTSLFKLSYGLFVISAKADGKDGGCIINTAMQVTDNPKTILISLNKRNFTHRLISETREFTLSVLSQSAPFSIFENFGFKSSRTSDKFDGIDAKRANNSIYYLSKYANAYISGKVIKEIDCGTHTMFFAEITEGKVLSDEPSVTYDYYFKHIKPAPAPKKKGYVCKICGYVYEGETLPDDFICPLCKHGAADFEPIK